MNIPSLNIFFFGVYNNRDIKFFFKYDKMLFKNSYFKFDNIQIWVIPLSTRRQVSICLHVVKS